jgi:hypothetical protein
MRCLDRGNVYSCTRWWQIDLLDLPATLARLRPSCTLLWMTPLLKIFLARQQASMQSLQRCSHAAQEKISGGVIQLGLSLPSSYVVLYQP